jgi:hypothetical protein
MLAEMLVKRAKALSDRQELLETSFHLTPSNIQRPTLLEVAMNKTVRKQSLLSKWLKRFHQDEDGIETLQIVMIVGVAVVILLVIVVFWEQIQGWFQGETGKFMQKAPKSP